MYFAIFIEFMKVCSSEIFQEKLSAQFYSGKIIESTLAGTFSSS